MEQQMTATNSPTEEMTAEAFAEKMFGSFLGPSTPWASTPGSGWAGIRRSSSTAR
jgi:hypothetical protein